MSNRERFEQWILSVNANDGHTIERIEPGEYRSAATDCAWEAWQAAEKEAVLTCAATIGAWSVDSDRSEHMLADIEQEFREAFE
jgi:hypothetical protein